MIVVFLVMGLLMLGFVFTGLLAVIKARVERQGIASDAEAERTMRLTRTIAVLGYASFIAASAITIVGVAMMR